MHQQFGNELGSELYEHQKYIAARHLRINDTNLQHPGVDIDRDLQRLELLENQHPSGGVAMLSAIWEMHFEQYSNCVYHQLVVPHHFDGIRRFETDLVRNLLMAIDQITAENITAVSKRHVIHTMDRLLASMLVRTGDIRTQSLNQNWLEIWEDLAVADDPWFVTAVLGLLAQTGHGIDPRLSEEFHNVARMLRDGLRDQGVLQPHTLQHWVPFLQRLSRFY